MKGLRVHETVLLLATLKTTIIQPSWYASLYKTRVQYKLKPHSKLFPPNEQLEFIAVDILQAHLQTNYSFSCVVIIVGRYS